MMMLESLEKLKEIAEFPDSVDDMEDILRFRWTAVIFAREILARYCPNGHLANGSPCVSYKCGESKNTPWHVE